ILPKAKPHSSFYTPSITTSFFFSKTNPFSPSKVPWDGSLFNSKALVNKDSIFEKFLHVESLS
ncbi:hypothetical protein RYX36_031036, partial [Vicia faba]